MVDQLETGSNHSYSPESVACSQRQPGEIILSSEDCNWRSLLLHCLRYPTNVEAFETVPTPDQLIVVVLRSGVNIQSFSGSHWRKAQYKAGRGGMTACGCSSRLRWSSDTAIPMETARIYLPRALFEALEDEYRSIGTPFRRTQRDTLSFEDPVIATIAKGLVAAAQAGCPDLYAESAALHMATHLISLSSSWATTIDRGRSAGILPKARVDRVLDFMRSKFREQISLNDLAQEAGITRFHFVSSFRAATGMSPHQHLIDLRMTEAAKLLSETEKPVQAIGREIGYASPAHFSAAFRKRFGLSAIEYRGGSRSK